MKHVWSGCRRQRVLGLVERRGLLSRETVGVMQGWGHQGRFSVHAGERVAAQDSAGRERLLRYCARPMFAAERLVWAGEGVQVRYRLPWSALQEHRVGQQRPIELRLSASEFLDRVALLIPPPRKHRHHYFGVLAPNSPWRELVTAQAGRKLAAGRAISCFPRIEFYYRANSVLGRRYNGDAMSARMLL